MKPLITIETVPISIEYVEKATTHKSSQSADLRITRENEGMTINSNPISISLTDTFENGSATDWTSLYYTATANYSGNGSLSMSIRFEDSDPGTYHFEQVSRGIDHIVNALPRELKSSSNKIESMQINFDISMLPDSISSGEGLDTSFLPPDLELKVVERPKVIIKYVGGPLYIPKSADPNYIAPEEINQVFDGKPNFDIKA